MTANSKYLAQAVNDPNQYNADGYKDSYFVQRERTGLVKQLSQTTRTSAVKTSVSTDYRPQWFSYIPILNLFTVDDVDYNAQTYDFASEG